MKKFQIWYSGPTTDVPDIVYAVDSKSAAKKFIIQTKGQYTVHECEEILPVKAVCVVILRNGKILCVSRKDDHNDFGLPGGKVDEGEELHEAIYREVLEETGYSLKYVRLNAFKKSDGDFEVTTFIGVIDNADPAPINKSETGLVEWHEPTKLLFGSFSDYNKSMLEHFKII